jgi:small subunit ribosomal protein S8
MANILLHQGFIYNVTRGTLAGPSPSDWLKAGLPDRRLWIDLKYRADERPVLEQLTVVSKPSRKLLMDSSELLRLATGRRAKFVKPLVLGEIGLVNCGKAGWFEVKDAIRRGLGGEVVARAS